MRTVITLFIILSIFLVACIPPQEAEPEEKTSSFVEVTERPSLEDSLKESLKDEPEEEADVQETTLEEGIKDPDKELFTPSVFVTDIKCDETGSLTFTLTNPLEKTTSLLPLRVVDIKTKEPLILTLNGRVIRDLDEWCGTKTLITDERVTCTTEFTPNKKDPILVRIGKDAFMKPLGNYIRVKTVALKAEATFVCA